MTRLTIPGLSLTLKLKVGRKGYIILPKALKEMVGLDEGDEVLVEVGDDITLKPVRRFNKEKLKAALKDHSNRIKNVPDLIEPEPGELAKVFLEVEFES